MAAGDPDPAGAELRDWSQAGERKAICSGDRDEERPVGPAAGDVEAVDLERVRIVAERTGAEAARAQTKGRSLRGGKLVCVWLPGRVREAVVSGAGEVG